MDKLQNLFRELYDMCENEYEEHKKYIDLSSFTTEELQTIFTPKTWTYYNITIFHYCCNIFNCLHIALQILDEYPNIDLNKDVLGSPLHCVVRTIGKNADTLLEKLLERGAVIDKSVADVTPLAIAVEQQNLSAIRILLSYGANPHLKTGKFRETPYESSVKYPEIREIFDSYRLTKPA